MTNPLKRLPHPPKPLMRGWLHAAAAGGAIAVTIGLLRATMGEGGRFWAMVVFGASMILLYLTSAVYHIGRWGPRMYRVLRSFDHANIFLLIAGTYTPFCAIILEGTWRVVLLATIWVLAAAGVVLKIGWPNLPAKISVPCYIGMGWLGVVMLPHFFGRMPWEALALLFGGGILYTIGGIVYGTQRPNPLPKIFGYHEVFHVFTIAANALFIIAIWGWIVPYAA